MQTQADIIDGTVYRPQVRAETTAMGAAYLAGLAVGYWNSLDEIRDNWAVDRVFQPRIGGRGPGRADPGAGEKRSGAPMDGKRGLTEAQKA